MKNIFWAGDSTVKHNRINTYPQTGIGQVFNLYLKAGIKVYNHAENGRSTKSFISEGRLEEIGRQIKEGDFLFIQFGHNDQKEDMARRTEAFGSYQGNLRQFVAVAKENGAYPLLITPLSRRIFNKEGSLDGHSHGDYPEAMKALAKELGVACIDLSEKSMKLINEIGEPNSRKWFMNLKPNDHRNYPDGIDDNTHLKHEGAVAMAGLLAEGLRELGTIYKDLLFD